MTIDISEEVADENNEFVSEINEDGKETEDIETIETAEVSFFPASDWLTNKIFQFYVPDEDAEQNNIDDSSNIKIEHVEHIQEKNHVRYISHSDKDGRSDMRKNLKCDLCGEMFPCYSLLKQHKYERKGITKSGLFPSVARPYNSEGLQKIYVTQGQGCSINELFSKLRNKNFLRVLRMFFQCALAKLKLSLQPLKTHAVYENSTASETSEWRIWM